jgi:hypothetical protein
MKIYFFIIFQLFFGCYLHFELKCCNEAILQYICYFIYHRSNFLCHHESAICQCSFFMLFLFRPPGLFRFGINSEIINPSYMFYIKWQTHGKLCNWRNCLILEDDSNAVLQLHTTSLIANKDLETGSGRYRFHFINPAFASRHWETLRTPQSGNLYRQSQPRIIHITRHLLHTHLRPKSWNTIGYGRISRWYGVPNRDRR